MRILHILGSADIGGIASVVYNYMRFIDREMYHFDFAVNDKNCGYLEKKMVEMGATFYRLPFRSDGLAAYSSALKKLLSEEKFDAIHVHSNSSSFLDLRIAKQRGIKCRVAHSHSTGPCTSILDYIRKYSGRVFNYHYATTVIGCGQLAGDEIFGKRHMRSAKGLVLPNAIDLERFRFNAEARQNIRNELNLQGKYIIGMMGRLAQQKNCRFAFEAISKIVKNNDRVVFLVIGDGEEREALLSFIHENGLEGSFYLLGSKNDVERYYSAMDILVMPSIFEGFPVAGIEAIASGLPVYFSDRITRELEFGKGVRYLPLVPQTWVEELSSLPTNEERGSAFLLAREHGFDIKRVAKTLEEVYNKAYQ